VRPGRQVEPVGEPDHPVPDGERLDAGADLVDDPGDVPTKPDLIRAGHEPTGGQRAHPGGHVRRVHRGRLDPEPNLALAGQRRRHLRHLQHVWPAERPDYHCSHDFLLHGIPYEHERRRRYSPLESRHL
jgi:hypothetical protein